MTYKFRTEPTKLAVTCTRAELSQNLELATSEFAKEPLQSVYSKLDSGHAFPLLKAI
jgi:hypothetical protein